MSMPGFWITRLTLSGTGVPDAEVCFRKGLNVVSGPSDTGKTYIAKCIDYALGASKAPKRILEAIPYERVSIGICAQDNGSELVLERSLRGGDICLRKGNQESILAAKHAPESKDTVSYLLLELANLSGRKVRVNQRGKTREISYRDLARLTFVDEEAVISEKSPIFSGQHTSRTVESSVFRLLMTGVDDSSVHEHVDPKVARSKRDAKVEVFDDLEARRRAQVQALEIPDSPASIRDQMEKIESHFEQASEELQVEQRSVAAIEDQRRSAWTQLRQVDSRLDGLSELQKRFLLLQEQYLSDLRRLEAISEAGLRLGQMKGERCPFCGALAEHHVLDHQKSHAEPADVALSCRSEARKIQGLMADLETTIADNEKNMQRLGDEQRQWKEKLEVVGTEIRTRLEPRLQNALRKLQTCQAQRDRYRRALELYDQIDEIERMRIEIAAVKKNTSTDSPSENVGGDEAELFCKEMEVLLRAWHFPNLDRVTFSEEDQDVIISGQRRSSHGKGVRAITHAAFNLALMRYCSTQGMGHPGVVAIDSPLVVYREPDVGEQDFALDVKDAFYRTLAGELSTLQVLIFENEDPPNDLADVATLIRFTGTDQGRQGFIPKARD